MSSPVLPQKAERVRMLLAAGVTHSQIARRTGLSRRTVARIAARGRRLLTAADIHDDRPAGFEEQCLNRCRGCGATVYLWPCLQCELRTRAEARQETRRLIKKGKSHTEARRRGEDQERPCEADEPGIGIPFPAHSSPLPPCPRASV